MAEHILLSAAHRSRRQDHWCPPDRASYDSVRGLWLRDGVPLIESADVRPGTKKRDFEPSNEDLKYE